MADWIDKFGDYYELPDWEPSDGDPSDGENYMEDGDEQRENQRLRRAEDRTGGKLG